MVEDLERKANLLLLTHTTRQERDAAGIILPAPRGFPVAAAPSEPAGSVLSAAEAGRLQACEAVIAGAGRLFEQIGAAFHEIEAGELWRAEYPTFAAYCQRRWELKECRAYQMIEAARVVEQVKNSTQVELPPPESERHARPLTRLKDTSRRLDAWQEAVETAPAGRVTAKHVERIVRRIMDAEPQSTYRRYRRVHHREVRLCEDLAAGTDTEVALIDTRDETDARFAAAGLDWQERTVMTLRAEGLTLDCIAWALKTAPGAWSVPSVYRREQSAKGKLAEAREPCG